MKKLYDKSEIWFAVVWIIIYVVLMGNLRNIFGDESIISLTVLLIIAALITCFIIKNKLTEKYGFVKVKDSKKYLFFIPLALLMSVNFWPGVSVRYAFPGQLIAVLTMLTVGYVEEVIFRGLLFKAMEKESVKRAIIISAVTFGAGHIINLLTGQASFDTLLQIAYATAIGFAFTMVFFGGWGVSILTGGLFYLTRNIFSSEIFLGLMFAIICATDVVLYNILSASCRVS